MRILSKDVFVGRRRITSLVRPNNRMHSDSKKRRSFVALPFAAGDAHPLGLQDDEDSRSNNHVCCVCSAFYISKEKTA